VSKKVGLVHVRSAAVVTAKCPPAGVQQFVNDHFQTGDFTGYTQSNMVIDNGSCGMSPFIGSYDAEQAGSYKSVSLQQNLANPVSAICLTVGSVFQITTADLGAICQQGTQNARILYSDGSYTDVALNPNGINTWVTYDLLPFVQAGKKISGLKWTASSSANYACDMQIGQVSLKMPAVGSTVIWDDGIAGEGASNWSRTYDETLSDDPTDKPDATHQSMDIKVGNDGAFDCYSPALSIDASKYAYISLWWKGNSTGQTIDLYLWNIGGGLMYVQFIDNFTGWKHIEILKTAWSNLVQIEICNDQASGLTKGLVFKIAYVTNNYP